jgi:hypothetical protein
MREGDIHEITKSLEVEGVVRVKEGDDLKYLNRAWVWDRAGIKR